MRPPRSLPKALLATAYGLVGYSLLLDGSCCGDGRWGSFAVYSFNSLREGK